MLPFLSAAERNSWHRFMTGDESRFFLNTSLRRMWALSRDHVVTKPRLDIQSKKFMLTITWNPNGFHAVDRLPNDMKMNSAYFLTNVLIILEDAIFARGSALHTKRLMIHLDNCLVHTNCTSTDSLEEHNIARMPYQPSSSDLDPSAFYLFATVKEKLERIQLADEDEFFRYFEGS
jgi:hypothetical protein